MLKDRNAATAIAVCLSLDIEPPQFGGEKEKYIVARTGVMRREGSRFECVRFCDGTIFLRRNSLWPHLMQHVEKEKSRNTRPYSFHARARLHGNVRVLQR